jgi:hypothetical protein
MKSNSEFPRGLSRHCLSSFRHQLKADERGLRKAGSGSGSDGQKQRKHRTRPCWSLSAFHLDPAAILR